MVEETDESVADERVETPYLQLVMTRLWAEEMAAGSGALRLATLTRLGGAQRIVRTHLDDAMGSLPAEEQEIAARVFHHLVTPSGTKIAHTAADLSAYAQVPEASLDRVLEELSGRARILRPVAPPPSDAAAGHRYEIFHDVLAAAILDWRGRYVLIQERAAAERRHVKELEDEARKKREAEKLAEKLAHELAQTEHRRARVARVAALALALLLVAALALAVVSVQGTRDAESKALAARAMQQLNIDPVEAVRLSLAALGRHAGHEAEEALRQSMSASFGRAVMQGHTGPVNTSVFSPDGKLLLTSGKDGTARIWEVPTGRAVRTLRGHTGELVGAVFSRDGALVLTWSRDKTVRVWQARSGRQLAVFPGHKDFDSGAAFSPDARQVLTWGSHDRARVWDWRKKVTLANLDAGRVQGAALSPDGRLVVTADSDGRLRMWTWRTRQAIVVSNKADSPAYLPTFSPDGATIVAAGFSGNLITWQWQTTKKIKAIITSIFREVESIEVSRDGKRLVDGGDKVAEVYELPSGRWIARLTGHTGWVNKATFNPDGNLVATASADGTARIWEVSAERPLVELRGHRGIVADAAFSQDGTLVATGSTDGTARTWAVPTGLALRGTDDWVLDARFSSDGRFVASAGGDGKMRVYDAATGRQLKVITQDNGDLESVAFSPHGNLIVTTAHNDAAPHLWHWRSGTKGPPLDPLKSTDGGSEPKYVSGVEFSPDGERVVAGASDGTARIWDAVTGHEVGTLQGPKDESVVSAEFSPDGRSVVTAGTDNTARIWDAATSRQRQVLRGHNGSVNSARYSRDGAFIVTASDDRTARVWDVATGRPLQTLSGQRSKLNRASFSPDGRLVVAGGADATTQVWEWRTGTVLAVLHQHADEVNDASFSPDGKLLLTASDDYTAKLYSCDLCGPLASVRELATERQRYLQGH
jgi:WD40 repeat protein